MVVKVRILIKQDTPQKTTKKRAEPVSFKLN